MESSLMLSSRSKHRIKKKKTVWVGNAAIFLQFLFELIIRPTVIA